MPTEPLADLSLVKTALSAEVLNGQQAIFSLVASNEGPSDAVKAKIVDTLPAGLTYVSATGASCTAEGALVTCPLGTVEAHTTRTVVLTVQAAGVATYVNRATVSSPTEDPQPANNSSEASVKVLPAASLRLEKTVSSPTIEVPSEVTYTLTARNEGPDSAQEVLVTDSLPVGETYVSDDAGCSSAGQQVTCPLGELANGASATIHLVVAVGVTLGAQTVTNAAVLTSTTGNPTPEEATAAVSVQTGPTADMAITKTGPATAVGGGPIEWTLNVTDRGPSNAHGVTVADSLPAGASYVSSSASQGACQYTAGTLTCELGTLAVGASAQVVVRATVTASSGTLQNTATVSPHAATGATISRCRPWIEGAERAIGAAPGRTRAAAARPRCRCRGPAVDSAAGRPRAFEGPWVLPLTAHSTVLKHFDGGDGQVALHGRGGASLADPLGSARSHGCVRLANQAIDWIAGHVAVGTPVRIY